MKKDILLSSSRAFSVSTPTFSLSTPVENSEATWKKATKCYKIQQMKFTKTHPIQTAVFCPLPLNAGDLGRTEQFSILSDERVVTNNDVDIVCTLKKGQLVYSTT